MKDTAQKRVHHLQGGGLLVGFREDIQLAGELRPRERLAAPMVRQLLRQRSAPPTRVPVFLGEGDPRAG